MRDGDQRVDTHSDAMNRLGRQILQCVSIGSGDQGKGVIMLMQESGPRLAPTRRLT